MKSFDINKNKIIWFVLFYKKNIFGDISFFHLGFLSETFTIHRAVGERRDNLFNSSLPLPPASQTLRYQPGELERGTFGFRAQFTNY